jgi:hypothetical protein
VLPNFCRFLCIYSINKGVYNSQCSISICAAAAFSIAAFSASVFAFAASAAFNVGCPDMGKSPGQPATREAGRIRQLRLVRHPAPVHIIKLKGNININ